MLEITIPERELFIEETETFMYVHETTLKLEHSLVSLHKWEKRHHKPFISDEKMTDEETIDYIRCMTITQNVDPDIYKYLTPANLKAVDEYINDPMTATWISSEPTENKTWGRKRKETVTAELIYYWMIALNIPMECQKWHLNSLLMLIQVCNIKNTPPKSMSKKERLLHNKALNDARKAKYNTKG